MVPIDGETPLSRAALSHQTDALERITWKMVPAIDSFRYPLELFERYVAISKQFNIPIDMRHQLRSLAEQDDLAPSSGQSDAGETL